VLVARTADQVAAKIDDYAVYEVDGFFQGSAALHLFADGSAEIAAVAVSEHLRRWGIGRKLVQYLMDRAHRLGLDRVFLLTTQTSDWFAELGFVKGDLGDLPPEKASVYDHARSSQIFVKRLPK
jgi:amino-acid N-acetyltransferase